MTVTLGGALFGLFLCALVLVPWYRKSGSVGKAPGGKGIAGAAAGRNYRALLPFAAALCTGTLLSLSVGGLLGTLAAWGRKGGDQAGDDSLRIMTGAHSYQVTHPGLQHLQAGSALVLLLVVTVMYLVWRKGAKALRRDLGLGLLAGITLGPTAAGIGLANTLLVPVMAAAGAQIQGWL